LCVFSDGKETVNRLKFLIGTSFSLIEVKNIGNSDIVLTRDTPPSQDVPAYKV